MFTEIQPYVLIAVGLLSLCLSIFYKAKNDILKKKGIPADGIIFNQDINTGSFSSKDQIMVRFLTENQDWITRPLNQGFQIFYSGQYKNGQKIKIFYDKENPLIFYVESG